MLHDQSPFFLGVGYCLVYKIKHSAKTESDLFYRKSAKFLGKYQLSSKSQRQENMHNKFVKQKRKSIINPLSISGHKKLESLKSYNQTPMNSQ